MGNIIDSAVEAHGLPVAYSLESLQILFESAKTEDERIAIRTLIQTRAIDASSHIMRLEDLLRKHGIDVPDSRTPRGKQ